MKKYFTGNSMELFILVISGGADLWSVEPAGGQSGKFADTYHLEIIGDVDDDYSYFQGFFLNSTPMMKLRFL